MRIALVDDEASQLQHLEALLVKELEVLSRHTPYRIDTYQNAQFFLEQWTAGNYDVIILDIFMCGITGIDVATQIRLTDPYVKLVFCSQSNDFASESYLVNAQYYLIKPATQDSISNMLKRLNLDQIQQIQTCTLPDGHIIIQRQILYTEYYNHVIYIHLKGGEIHHLRAKHSDLEDLLISCGYICSPNRGILINFHEVTKMQDTNVLMSDGTMLPISRRKSKEVRAAYAKFYFQKMRMEVDKE